MVAHTEHFEVPQERLGAVFDWSLVLSWGIIAMRAKLLIVMWSLIIVSCSCCFCGRGAISRYGWFRSEESIRKTLIKQTPLGLPKEEVLKCVNKKYGSAEFFQYYAEEYTKLGGGYISRELTSYPYIFPIFWTRVYAIWIFEKEGKLVEIEVHKWVDAVGS